MDERVMVMNAKRMFRTAGLAVLLATAAPLAALAEAETFPTPEAAAEAVIAALEVRDRDRMLAIFGPENEDVISTGDAEEDREVWGEFLRDYREMHRVAVDVEGRATLYTGRDQYPFPAPIVQAGDGSWYFDAPAAREEVQLRRIGRNELDVIDLMRAYVRVQRNYRLTDWDGDGVLSFAGAIISDAGKRDGLYWPDEPGVVESPVGDFMARASADGFSVGGQDAEAEPFLGYYFRVLTRQGDAAPGGAMDYVVNGHMLAGHALLAFPAAYDDTGIMSFMVGESGVVYEADLGEDTLAVAAAIESFDPGDGWMPVE
jgi:hypothetical protein